MSCKYQELLTIREHLRSTPAFCLSLCLLIFLVFCIVFFVCLCSVSCVYCCPCLWIVHYGLHFRFSLTFICIIFLHNLYNALNLFIIISRRYHEWNTRYLLSTWSHTRLFGGNMCCLLLCYLFLNIYIYIYVIETEGANSLELFCLSGF